MGKHILRASTLLIIAAALFVLGCNGIIHMDLPSGTPIWARTTVGGTARSLFYSVVAANDGIYSSGALTQGTLDFGSNIIANGLMSAANLIIIKYSHQGTPIWVRYPIVATGFSGLNDMVTVDDGILAVGWISSGAFELGNSITISDSSLARGILLKFYSDGTMAWAQIAEGTPVTQFEAIIRYGNYIYIVGYFSGSGQCDFGNSVILTGNSSSANPFIVKYDLNGIAQWAKTILSGPSTDFTSLTVGNDSIYIVGGIYGIGTVDFGNSVSVSALRSSANPLLVKYQLNGDVEWAVTSEVGTTDDVLFNGVDCEINDIYVVGKTESNGIIRLGSSVKTKGISEDGNCVLAKYNKNGIAQWARTATVGASWSEFNDVCIQGDYVFVCGSMGGYSTFGFGNGLFIDAVGYSNPLLLKYDLNGNALLGRSIISPVSGQASSQFYGIDCDSSAIFIAGRLYNGHYNFSKYVSADQIGAENVCIVKYSK